MPRISPKLLLAAAVLLGAGVAYLEWDYIWPVFRPIWRVAVLLMALGAGFWAGYRFRARAQGSPGTASEDNVSAWPRETENAGPDARAELEAAVRAAVQTAVPAALRPLEALLGEHQRQMLIVHESFQRKLQTRMDQFQVALDRAAVDRPPSLIKAVEIRDHHRVVPRTDPAPTPAEPEAFPLNDDEPDVGFIQRDPVVAGPAGDRAGASKWFPPSGDPRPPTATLEDLLQECAHLASSLHLGREAERRLVAQLRSATDKKAMLKHLFVFLANGSGDRLDSEFDWQVHRPALQNLLQMSGMAGAVLILPGIGDQRDSETMNDLSTAVTGPRATVRQVIAPGFRLKTGVVVHASILT